jgi:demethylmenaquinone methyltransferase/2-methoxy-6-polyprenyl-1,4-benzoquinol methylase
MAFEVPGVLRVGVVVAIAITASWALGPWVSGRPDRGLSNRSGIPRSGGYRELATRDLADRTDVMGSAGGGELGRLLAEQVTYYRSLAADYLNKSLDLPGGDELTEALEAFRPAGSVLELACGPGVWTSRLLHHATDVTAVDASPEMLAIAASRVGDDRVRFVQADLFTWVPDRRYDVVFIGFWLSHVPPERFASFWTLVADCLKEDGRVFFADDAYRSPEELVEGPSSATIRRRLDDGTSYRIVKVPHRPADLEQRLRRLGWHITVTATSGQFYWGAGGRS